MPEECQTDTAIQQQSSNITSSVTPPLINSPQSKAKDGDSFVLLAHRRLMSDPAIASLTSIPSQPDVGSMVWSLARQSAARPGHVQRLQSDTGSESELTLKTMKNHEVVHPDDNSKRALVSQTSPTLDENHHLDDECLQRFIKTNVRLMTEDRVRTYLHKLFQLRM